LHCVHAMRTNNYRQSCWVSFVTCFHPLPSANLFSFPLSRPFVPLFQQGHIHGIMSPPVGEVSSLGLLESASRIRAVSRSAYHSSPVCPSNIETHIGADFSSFFLEQRTNSLPVLFSLPSSPLPFSCYAHVNILLSYNVGQYCWRGEQILWRRGFNVGERAPTSPRRTYRRDGMNLQLELRSKQVQKVQ